MEELQKLNNRKFYKFLNVPEEDFKDWLVKLNLIFGDERKCNGEKCGGLGKMYIRDRGVKGITYRCTTKNCRKEMGMRKGTFFDRSHLPFKDIFEMSYLWSHDQLSIHFGTLSLTNEDGSQPSSRTLVNWRNFFRDHCAEYYQNNPIIIGGPGIEILIHETLITKKKRRKNGGGSVPAASETWFFGGIEIVSGRAFMKAVESLNQETLVPLIQTHIHPGSIIISDSRRSYASHRFIPEGYIHRIVVVNISEENFVNPPATENLPNSIEGLWLKFKSRNKSKFGTTRDLIEKYMDQFLWLRDFKDDAFYHLWCQIKEKYPI